MLIGGFILLLMFAAVVCLLMGLDKKYPIRPPSYTDREDTPERE